MPAPAPALKAIPATALLAAPSPAAIAPVPIAVMASIPGRWIACGMGLSVLVVALMLFEARLSIEIATASSAVFLSLGLFISGVRYRFGDPQGEWQRTVRDIAEYVGLFGAMCLLGAVASYPMAADSAGFVDPALERIDRLLHFDWLGWYGVVSAHPLLQTLGMAAYSTIYTTPALLLGYFAYANRQADARLFLATFWLAAVFTLALFQHFPAEGALAFLWHGRLPYVPMSALYQAQLIPELRNHTIHTISLGALHGLVSAPSFHTTSAVLYIATGWRVRPLRWLVLAINCAMLLSIPVEGTHYLADMIFGMVVALAAIAVMSIAKRTLLTRA